VKLSVVHRTSYTYADTVTTSHHEARLSPRDSEVQRTISHDVTVSPTPEARRRRFDYFGNRTIHFSLCEPHRTLDVVAESIVELTPVRPPNLHDSPAWEEVRARLRVDRRRDVLDAYGFTFDSPFVKQLPALFDFTAEHFTPGRPLLEAVHALMHAIFTDFTYDPRATDVSTPLSEILATRRGVCQDFAHLGIACLRSHGLSGRYVSGYLLTHPPPGKPRLVGADASHAWFATFVPDYGWVDFDPTNDVIPQGEHVTVAYGRDFDDVTPIRGVILGGGSHHVAVSVDVDVVPDKY
jgi:transglutaminase-like putative cysteine protease